MFTEEELKIFKVVQLRRLADFYGVKYNAATNKTDLIAKLMEVLNQPGSYEMEQTSEPPMSARVRRIMIQNKDQNNG
jgi:hypothetical protein